MEYIPHMLLAGLFVGGLLPSQSGCCTGAGSLVPGCAQDEQARNIILFGLRARIVAIFHCR